MHAAHPRIVTYDDYEVENDYAGKEQIGSWPRFIQAPLIEELIAVATVSNYARTETGIQTRLLLVTTLPRLEVSPGEDGRTRLVCISPEGERALDEGYPMWQAAQEEVVSALGKERYEALLDDVGRAVALAADGSPGSSNGARDGAA